MHRPNRPLRLGVLALGTLLLLGSSGCLFLEPDSADSISVRMIARTPEAAGGLGRAAVDPATVLASDDLVARAQLFRSTNDEFPGEVLREVPLSIGPLVAGTREISGRIDFDLGPAGSKYALRAQLLFLGLDVTGPDALDPAGSWFGEIGFGGRGFNVNVSQLTLVATGTPNRYDGSILLTHPSVDDPATVPLQGVVFDPQTGRITMSYRAPELVQWDQSTAALEVIVVDFEGAFAPVVAFEATEAIDVEPSDNTIVLDLLPINPIEPGQRIEGTLSVTVHQNDGTGGPGAPILSESGRVVVRRVQRDANAD